MIDDFGFAGGPYRTGIMHVRRSSNTAYISNYRYWKQTYRRDTDEFFHVLIIAINHEGLHKLLRRIKTQTASKSIDKRWLFGNGPFEQELIGIYIPIPDPPTFPLVVATHSK